MGFGKPAVLLLFSGAAFAQPEALPVILGRTVTLLPPAVDGSGRSIVFGSAIGPNGAVSPTVDLYAALAAGGAVRRLTALPGGPTPPQGATDLTLSPDGARGAFLALTQPGKGEEVHVVDVATAADRVVSVYTEGCIQPLCANCFFTCANTPHLAPDGNTVLYSVRRNQPFFTVRADGTGLTRLPIYSGILAAGPQRVIARSGTVVFTSSAPAGPTFAATATEVYLMALDGSNVRQVTHFGNDASIFASAATISADGGAIAFECNLDPQARTASNTRQIWVVKSDGTGLRALTSGPEGGASPTISGDGSLVAFVSSGQLQVARADGSGSKPLTNFQYSAAQDPAISEDGSRVIFAAGPKSFGRGAIYIVNADGTGLRALYAPRAIMPFGVVGIVPGTTPSPGSLFDVYGANLAPDGLTLAGGFPLPAVLAGASLRVDGKAVPLLAATPWQMVAEMPPDTAPGSAGFQFEFADGSPSAPVRGDIAERSPAIFNAGTDTCQAAAFHAGTATPADKAHPAAAGEVLEIYGTGLGGADPPVPAGMPGPIPPARVAPPEVRIGNQRAVVSFAGLAPGLVGVYQVNAAVPAGVPPGQQPLTWNGASGGCAIIAVR